MTRDLRKYASQTRVRLLIGLFVLLFLVGDGLIYLIYGQGSALMGVICLLAGLVPAGLIALILAIMDWTVKRANRD